MKMQGDAGGSDELADAHSELLALVRRLEAAMDDAATPEAIGVLSDGIVDANARATRLGARLLVARTDEVRANACAVSTAIAEVEGALDDVSDQRRLVAGVTQLLGVADQAIAAIERLA